MGTKQTIILMASLTVGGLWAADATPAAARANDADVKTVVETIQSLGGLLQNLDGAANSLADGEAKSAESSAPGKGGQVDKQGRPLKNTIAIITAGAAAGASIGAATKKGTQAIVIGAIAGAAAGLIYDRMTAEKKNQPDGGTPGGEAKKPEVIKESGKPVPATATPLV